MDMRMLSYLERKMAQNDNGQNDETNNRRGVPDRRRNTIGFSDDNEYRRNEMRSHKEAPEFEDDDFDEIKTHHGKVGRGQSKNIDHELIELMEKSFHKELCDVLRYCEMARMAEEEGLEDIAEGLEELCHNEFMHAKFFRMGLRYLGADAERGNAELSKLWHKVNKKMEKDD